MPWVTVNVVGEVCWMSPSNPESLSIWVVNGGGGALAPAIATTAPREARGGAGHDNRENPKVLHHPRSHCRFRFRYERRDSTVVCPCMRQLRRSSYAQRPRFAVGLLYLNRRIGAVAHRVCTRGAVSNSPLPRMLIVEYQVLIAIF